MSQWQGIFLKASIVSTCDAGLVVTEVTPGVGKSSTWKPDDLFLTDGQMFSILFDFHGLMVQQSTIGIGVIDLMEVVLQ